MNTDKQVSDALNKSVETKSGRRFEVDVERYQAYLDDPALSADERTEIIKALWTIVSAFVELGFEVHPTQQACGKVEKTLEQGGFSDSTEVQSGQHKNAESIDVSGP